jgi:predicted nucleotidyltransferase
MAASSTSLPPTVSEALARFKQALGARFGARLREVVLFGSVARSEAHEESDVDVLVVIDELDERERMEVVDLAYGVDLAMDEEVGLAPLPYSSAQAAKMRSGGRRLFRDIDTQGIRL